MSVMSFQNPDIIVKKVESKEAEAVEIRCHEENETVKEIVTFVKSRQGQLSGVCAGQHFEVPIIDVIYIESVDNRTFIYTKDNSYETRQKLYELEDVLKQRRFIRISKATILNLMKVSSIKPALNGRFLAHLINGEDVIISRKYVSELKKMLKGEGK